MTDFKKPSTWLIMCGKAVWGLACFRVAQRCFHVTTSDEGLVFGVVAFVCVCLGAAVPHLVAEIRKQKGEPGVPDVGFWAGEVFYGCFMTGIHTIPLLVLLHLIGVRSFLGMTLP